MKHISLNPEIGILQRLIHSLALPAGLKLLLLALLIQGCAQNEKKDLFRYVDSSRSGISFSNVITENDSVNPKDCLNCFNGGGVGIGDFNKDGLPDLVFSGSQVSSKLYMNRGSLRFEDVSEQAGFATSSWVTGVNIVDVNADGWDDIYLNVGGVNCEDNCNNLLFINQGADENGIPSFVEMAGEYGLDDGRYAQQSVFYDYDGDGDLDVYIVHNKNKTNFNRNTPRPKAQWPEYLTDYLLRNDSVAGLDHPVFTNVSGELGLDRRGFGLGVGIADFNNDQRIDLYVSNDFISDDFLYINKFSGDSMKTVFEEASAQYLGHITTNAMGMDIADINDDGISDIMVLDMLPKEYTRHKRVMMEMNYSGYLMVTGNGYTPQYMRNTLQLGNGELNGNPVRMSEVGLLYGISSTDWSWAPLMVDFDNDGDKDLYISNGYIKDVIDLDYIKFSMQNNAFSPKLNQVQKFLEDLPPIKVPNIFFEHTGPDSFEDVSGTWIEELPSLSNGVAYADLDLDGDLDLAVNNINQEAFLLENRTSQKLENHYLRLRLKGQPKNPKAIGAKVTVWSGQSEQHQFQSVIRGYLSSVEPILHFGLPSNMVDSLRVTWPDGKVSMLRNPPADQVVELEEASAARTEAGISVAAATKASEPLFKENTEILNFSHLQVISNEFLKQPLLTKQFSRKGPALAAADIDGIPGDEIYIGGGLGGRGRIWSQGESGNFLPLQALDSINEETDALFFDADQDGDLDLYVASGGNLFDENSPFYADRLYRNDGKGQLTLDPGALPQLNESTSCVVPMDVDHDGDTDLFVGSRIIPRKYPWSPKSSLLINENGKFKEQTPPALARVGMVSGADFRDIDGDGWEDLIVVGEFMGVSIFKNHQGELRPLSLKFIDENDREVGSEGWWNSVAAADFDKDGDVDLIVGNHGLNSFVKPTEGSPIYVYNKDFDEDGKPDPVLGQYFQDKGKKKLFPVHTRDDIEKQFPDTKIRFVTYEQFSEMDYRALLEIKDLDSETLRASTFASCYLENLGEGTFRVRPLPQPCQYAPVNDILVDDFDKDGYLDALLVGNDFSSESNYGRFDAFTGGYLKGSSEGFLWIPSSESGFYVPQQSNELIQVRDREGRTLILAGQNNDRIKVFE